MMIPLASRMRLAALSVGESVVLRENSGANAGALSQSYASRAGIKITTRQCFVVVPSSEEMIKALLITRTV